MSVDPNRAPQPEASHDTVQALWRAANTLVADRPQLSYLGRFRSFGSQIDGFDVDVTVMVHPEAPAEDGVIGAIGICPDMGIAERDTTCYQFRAAANSDGVVVNKLLPVDFSTFRYSELQPTDPLAHREWNERYEEARDAFEAAQRADHSFYGFDTVYENEIQNLVDVLNKGKAWFDSQEETPAPAAKASFLGALMRKWFGQG
jgi:hypothetical protein